VVLLDTNVCIRLLNEAYAPLVSQFKARSPNEIYLCSVVKAELLYGARHSQRVDSNLHRLKLFFAPMACLPFDDMAAEHYAMIRADLSVQGQLIGPTDLMIAAIARANELTLITHNIEEFRRVAGLKLEDWEADNS